MSNYVVRGGSWCMATGECALFGFLLTSTSMSRSKSPDSLQCRLLGDARLYNVFFVFLMVLL